MEIRFTGGQRCGNFLGSPFGEAPGGDECKLRRRKHGHPENTCAFRADAGTAETGPQRPISGIVLFSLVWLFCLLSFFFDLLFFSQGKALFTLVFGFFRTSGTSIIFSGSGTMLKTCVSPSSIDSWSNRPDWTAKRREKAS